jgi:hypothetical protein
MKFDPADSAISDSLTNLGQFCAVFKGYIEPRTSGLHSFQIFGLNNVVSDLNSFIFRFDGFVIERISLSSPNSVFSSYMNVALLYEVAFEFCGSSTLMTPFELQLKGPSESVFSAVDPINLYTNGTVLASNHVNVEPSFVEYFYPSSILTTQLTSGVPSTFSFSSLDKFGNVPNSCVDEDVLVILSKNPRFSSRNVLCSHNFYRNNSQCDIFATCTPSLLPHVRNANHDWKLKVLATREPGLLATYYSSTSLAAPVATRLASSIDFSGSSLSSQPVSSLVSGVGWSVRWSGFVRAPVAGGATWTFFIGLAQGGNGGDGVRGWVDGVAVVDAWGGIAGSEVSGTVVLSGASNSYYEVVVEYKAVGAAYGCTLSWSELSVPKQLASRLVSGGRFSFTEYQFRSWSSKGL